MNNINQLWRRATKLVADTDVSGERLLALLWFPLHTPYMTRHRAGVILSRIQIISWAFAVLTAAWIGIDFVLLPKAVAAPLAALRLTSTAVFIYLGWPRELSRDITTARTRLALLMLNPLLFYLVAEALFAGIKTGGLSVIFIHIYALLPFIVVAGLSVFPLTILESAVVGFAALAAMAVGPPLSHHVDLDAYFAACWTLFLLIWVSVLAAAIQLNYMMSLVQRISVDQLTGAYTRDSGKELIDLYFHISLEHDTPFAVAFCDLDRFKQINDGFGHEAGDAALRDSAMSLHRYLRRSGMVVRWGGEEFVLVLTGTDADGARLILQRLLRDWLGMRPDHTPLTASIGLGERITAEIHGCPQLLEMADRRMYLAKRQGRARAVMCGDEVMLSPAAEAPRI